MSAKICDVQRLQADTSISQDSYDSLLTTTDDLLFHVQTLHSTLEEVPPPLICSLESKVTESARPICPTLNSRWGEGQCGVPCCECGALRLYGAIMANT